MAHLPENAHAVHENAYAVLENALENAVAAPSTPERPHAGQVISPVCPCAPCPQQRTCIQGPGIIPPFGLPADDNDLPVVVGYAEDSQIIG
jgi:hypothetical protein